MMPYDYKYQNPSGFACLMLIRAIVIFYPIGNTKFKYEKKNKLNCGSCSQMTPSGNCLFAARNETMLINIHVQGTVHYLQR